MTIDITVWRRVVACLVASTGVVLALALAAGDAQARLLDHKPSGYDRCPKTYVCLFQDSNGRNRIIWYRAYGTYRLKAKSMVGTGTGVTSYYNHQTGGARATLIGLDFTLNLRNGVKQNVPPEWNDKAIKVRLLR